MLIQDASKRRRRRCFLSGGFLPPLPNGWFDGGYPLGFASTIMFPVEGDITTINADNTTFNDTTIENASPSCRFVLEPGTYTMAPSEFHDFYVEFKDFIHIVGKEQAWVSGAPNPNGTYLTGFTLWQNSQVLLENLIFNDISDLYDSSGGPDYGIYSHRDVNIQLKNCVFAGMYIHDVSLKRANDIAEIVGCKFRDSERHCVEVGQEINYVSDLTQVQNTHIYGNDFEGAKNNFITVMSSKNVYIHQNRFHNGGRLMRLLPLNQFPPPQTDLKLLEAPMRTEFVGNDVTGTFGAIWTNGRGRVDDVVYFQDNTGITSSDYFLDPMTQDDQDLFAAANDPVDTAQGQTNDPASDI